MKIKNITRITLAIFALTILSFSSITKTVMPEIKGIYTLFSPDTIGMGQALMRKGWIENVHFYAAEDNLAKTVVKRFWTKRGEVHPLEVSNVALIANMTPEIFGKLLNYVVNIKKRTSASTEEIKKAKDIVIDPWVDTFNIEKKKKKENVIKEIERLKEELNQKKSTQESRIKQVEESTDAKDTKKIKNEKIAAIKKEIAELNKKIKDKTGALTTLSFNEKDAGKLKEEIKSLINSIEALVNSEGKDFIEGTTEAILWAFFEKKFTREDALRNFLICLDQFENKKDLTGRLGKERYLGSDKSKFEREFGEKVSAEDKIKKIIADYGVSTYSMIKSAALEVLPPKVSQGKLFYKYKNQNTKEDFPTCFETALLDIISILFFNPEENKYDLDLVPQEMRGDLFGDITENVFKEVDEKTNKREIISPSMIDSRLQSWVNIISNQAGIRYNKYENIDGETVRFDLNTTFENLVKILNKIFNLGFVIADDREKLIIENVDLIGNPKDIKQFWEKIFEYISKKLSTDDREILFELVEGANKGGVEEYTLSKNKVEIAGYYKGIVKVSIFYKNFNSYFLINIESGHAYITSKIREMSGLTLEDSEGEIVYNDDFINLLTENFYSKEKDGKKLVPLFIMLSNPNMLRKFDTKEYNLFIYCLNLKDSQEKFEFIRKAIKTGAIEAANIAELAYKLFQELPEDPALIGGILEEIFELKGNRSFVVEKMLKNIYAKAKKSDLIARVFIRKAIKTGATEAENIAELVSKLFQGLSEDIVLMGEILEEIFKLKGEKNLVVKDMLKNIFDKAEKSDTIAKVFIEKAFDLFLIEDVNIIKLVQKLFEKFSENSEFMNWILKKMFDSGFENSPIRKTMLKNIYGMAEKSAPIAKEFIRLSIVIGNQEKNIEKLTQELLEKLPEDATFIGSILEKFLKKSDRKDSYEKMLKIIYDKAEKSAPIAKAVLVETIKKNIFTGSNDSIFKIISAASFDSEELESFLEGIERKNRYIDISLSETLNYSDIVAALRERYTKNSDKLVSYIEANNIDEAIKLIKDPETNINGIGNISPLNSAISKNSVYLVKNILEHKNNRGEPDVNVNKKIDSVGLLEKALTNKELDIEIVKLLLNYKNKKG